MNSETKANEGLPAGACSPCWVASNDRLPDTMRRVLMFKWGTLTVGHWNCEVAAWYCGLGGNYEGPWDALEITYWAELPSPPPGETYDDEE